MPSLLWLGTVDPTVLVSLLQSALPGVGPLLDQLLGTTPTDAAIYGGSGLLSVGVVRWLVNRRAARGNSGGTSVQTTGSTRVSTTAGSGTQKHNVAFTLPSFLPVSDGIRHVTHNEIHALELGLVVGVVSVWLLSIGKSNVVHSIVIAFVAGSLGYKRYSSKAFKTIRYEPWYALLALAGGGAFGWALFISEPGLLTYLGV